MRLALVSVALLRFAWGTAAFVAAPIPKSRSTCVARWATTDSHEETWPSEPMVGSSALSRRSALAAAAGGMTAALVAGSMVSPVQAAVGNLPEYQDTNVILQGLTIQVSDRSQLDQMVNFLRNGFDFKIVRQRAEGAVLDVVRDTKFVESRIVICSVLMLAQSSPLAVVGVWTGRTRHSKGIYGSCFIFWFVWWTRFHSSSVR